jgi:hypothetical protein
MFDTHQMRSTTPMRHRVIDYVDQKLDEHAAYWKVEIAEEIARQLDERVTHTHRVVTGDQSSPLMVWDDMASGESPFHQFNHLNEALASHSMLLSSFEKRLCCSEEALGAVQALIPETLPKNSSSAEDAILRKTTFNEAILEELKRLQDVIGNVLVTTSLRETKPKTSVPESPNLRWLHDVEPCTGIYNTPRSSGRRSNLRIGVQSVPLPRHSYARPQNLFDSRLDGSPRQATPKRESYIAAADDHSVPVR